ncbi:MAG: molybdopterin-dependent oxidoreductase [Deltaproteobacteria bacterium]|nr:molybdopterin-dependent oxidoreductase [Deltaproteobacteria bacterium]
MKISRRNFIKLGAAVGATAPLGFNVLNAFSQSNLKLQAGSEQELEGKFTGYDVKYTYDSYCPSECGLEVCTKDGKVEKIYGNYADPYNHGKMCGKGPLGCGLINSTGRILHPMMRTGKRGEGKFKRVSWDEALNHIAKKIVEIKKKHGGGESVIVDTGDMTDTQPYYRMGRGAIACPHVVEHGSICDVPRRFGPKNFINGKRWEPDLMRPVLVRQSDGSLKEMGYDDLPLPKYIVYLGWNPFTATRIHYESRGTVTAALKGCRVIVVDPAMCNTAAWAANNGGEWVPIRPGTDNHLLGAILRYILEKGYEDKDFIAKYTKGFDEFVKEFKSYWNKTDGNGLKYFSLEWAEEKTTISKDKIKEIAELIGTTKPGAVVWGMNGIGHRFAGYIASMFGTAIDVVTGNIEAPGGVIDCNQVRISKDGYAGHFQGREITRTVNGKTVKGKQGDLHMDEMSDWPAGWEDVVGDHPRRILEGVEIKYGPFKGYKYPIKARFEIGGNTMISGSATWKWQEALTAVDPKTGEYLLDLNVSIDSVYLENALYADVVLPAANYLERYGIADIYPSCPVAVLRDQVIKPLGEAKTQVEIMNAVAKALYDNGDKDVDPKEFWLKYKHDDIFWTEAIEGTPGKKNVGEPLPYPKLPKGYTLIGTPDSLEAGRVKIDNEKKVIQGEPITVDWLRKHQGVAVWPMAWRRYEQVIQHKSGKIEFVWSRMENYNEHIKGGAKPYGFEILEKYTGVKWDKYPTTFFWFDPPYNPASPRYAEMVKKYPFQLISARVHQGMTATYANPQQAETPTDSIWWPLNKEFEAEVADWVTEKNGMGMPQGSMKVAKKRFTKGTHCVGACAMNPKDAEANGVNTGDVITIENMLGKTQKSVVLVTDTVRPSVLKMPYGGGGRFSPGVGTTYQQKDYTANVNQLVDPNLLSPIVGFPGYVDIIARIVAVEAPSAKVI